MPLHTVQYCRRCGRAFKSGQARYLVTIHLVADFDGSIEPPGNPPQIEKMWKEIEDKSEQELTNEVAQKLSFMLCKPCRDAWVSSPFGEFSKDVPSSGDVH